MAAIIKDPVEGREVVQCVDCELVQFRTLRGQCRKCHAPYCIDAPAEATSSVPSSIKIGSPRPHPDPNHFEIGFAIWLLRQARGLSQNELASLLQVPRTYVSKIERNCSIPHISKLYEIADALTIPLAVLIEFSSFLNPEGVSDEDQCSGND